MAVLRHRVFVRLLVVSLTGVLLLCALAWWVARPVQPDEFYAPTAELPPRPGALIRSERIERDIPAGAVAWRILYTTTRADGISGVASAIVMTSRAPAAEPRPVVAWAHGTTGVQPGCAPPLMNATFANVPSVGPLVDAGWVYVATDYIGQGTDGPHPYLIGEGQARSVLDSVRAVRQLKDVRVADATVVWGHSQGGHAALWTGQLAPHYAPDVALRGVAAIAPASDLPQLIEPIQHTLVGRIMTSYLLSAYSSRYDDVRFHDYSSGLKGALARDMASRCLAGAPAIVSIASAGVAGGTIFARPPAAGPLARRLRENVPTGPWPMPLFIAQGEADVLVLPDLQRRYVQARCAEGAAVEYVTYAGRDHLSVVAGDSPLVDELMTWSRVRLSDDSVAPAAGTACFDRKR